MTIFTAFSIGILGSLHCLGMCGPLAFALPLPKSSRNALLISRLTYNLGRVLAYAILGALVGILGKGIAFGISQQGLSISIGLLLLIFFLISPAGLTRFKTIKPITRWNQWIKGQLSFFWKKKGPMVSLGIGFLNGFLPCGLVYLALAGGLATGTLWGGITFMVFFGLGTIPLMLAASLGMGFVKPRLKSLIYRKALPVFTLLLASWFILRGFDLGIPYLSPKISSDQAVECCEPTE